ncbi:MAG: undecaprenyl-diphosphate phosphatase [Clostridia bacterium]|nr:undecaprenyl-diphosphate phosphatase [Clostridia bacterium]
MDVIHSLILGIVQGLTELLPVSSSAHLNLFPWMFGWEDIQASFDVALHIGTLLAIIVFFYKDWVKLFKGGYEQVKYKKKTTEGRLFWYIVLATIPTGILCLILDKLSDKMIVTLADGFRLQVQTEEMLLIAVALIVMGIILYVVDKKSKSKYDMKQITFKQALLISMSQALAAAFPGVSRSGITMTVGRKMGIKREAIAKFSFLLSTPVVAAAALVKMKDFVFGVPFLVGVLASFIVGMLVIKFLLKYLQKGSFKVFAIYRVVLGLIVIAMLFFKM